MRLETWSLRLHKMGYHFNIAFYNYVIRLFSIFWQQKEIN